MPARDLTREQQDAVRPLAAELVARHPQGVRGLARDLGAKSHAQLSRFISGSGGMSIPHAAKIVRMSGKSPMDFGIVTGAPICAHASWPAAAAIASQMVDADDVAAAGDFVPPGPIAAVTPAAVVRLAEAWQAMRLRTPAEDAGDVVDIDDERRERAAREKMGEPPPLPSGRAHRRSSRLVP